VIVIQITAVVLFENTIAFLQSRVENTFAVDTSGIEENDVQPFFAILWSDSKFKQEISWDFPPQPTNQVITVIVSWLAFQHQIAPGNAHSLTAFKFPIF
jgi:hypothetical protein